MLVGKKAFADGCLFQTALRQYRCFRVRRRCSAPKAGCESAGGSISPKDVLITPNAPQKNAPAFANCVPKIQIADQTSGKSPLPPFPKIKENKKQFSRKRLPPHLDPVHSCSLRMRSSEDGDDINGEAFSYLFTKARKPGHKPAEPLQNM